MYPVTIVTYFKNQLSIILLQGSSRLYLQYRDIKIVLNTSIIKTLDQRSEINDLNNTTAAEICHTFKIAFSVTSVALRVIKYI